MESQMAHNQMMIWLSVLIKPVKRTLSGPITKVSDENRVCLIQNEAIVGFDQLGTGRRPREGDLNRDRYLNIFIEYFLNTIKLWRNSNPQPLMSHQQTILGCVVDLVQERYTSPSGLDQGWRNVYCYLYPLPIDSNGTLQIKYIKFIDFGTTFDLLSYLGHEICLDHQ